MLVTHMIAAQTDADKKLISASQAGSSPLYFTVNDVAIPLIEPGSYYNEQECNVRNGMPNLFAKLNAGKSVSIGYIGGSITQGVYCYRTQSAKYIASQFPKVNIQWMNAGVSGTGTDLAACRLQDQLLQFKPDMIFIEFAVNGAYQPGMEGIIRQVIKDNPSTDICLIYTVLNGQAKLYQEGKVPENIQGLEKIAAYYHLPSIHLGMEAALLEKEGKLIWKGTSDEAAGKILFSTDGIHPLKEGGNIYAAAIARGFQKMKAEATPHKHTLPQPLMKDNWESATMLDPLSVATFSEQWTKIDPATTKTLKAYKSWFPYLMTASQPGASFSFKFNGSMFGIFDVGGPEVGQLEVEIDGKPVQLQEASAKGYHLYKAGTTGSNVLSRFNNFCNNRYRGQYDFIEVEPGEHTVIVRIAAEKADKVKILGPKQLADITEHPEKYDQTVFYLGKILLRGNPVQ